MARRAVIVSCFLLGLSLSSASAKLLGGGDPIDRGGNRAWEWCPCTNDPDSTGCVKFTPESGAVLVRFRAATHTTIDSTCCCYYVECEPPDPSCRLYLPPPFTKYMRQRIDNIMVVSESDFRTNLEYRGKYCETCDTLFVFDHLADKRFVYRESFDSGVDATWDLSNGAFFDASVSGPADLRGSTDPGEFCPGENKPFSGPGGSLGFGHPDSLPVLPECCHDEVRRYASTRTLIGGLQPGTPYVLSFWWASELDENCSGTAQGGMPLLNGDLTVSVLTCDMAMGFRFAPRQLNLSGHGGTVTGYLEPPPGHTIAELDVSTITLQGKVHVAAGSPPAIGDYDKDGIPELKLKFPRAELQALLSEGSQVPISVSGFAAGDVCFDGTDVIRVRAAAALNAPVAGSILTPGTQVDVCWERGRGTVDLLSSFDDGLTWQVEARAIPNSGIYSWSVPWVPTKSLRLAVGKILSTDATGVVFDAETGEAGPLSIASVSDVVEHGATFSLVSVSPNPTRRGFTVTFALPNSAPASVTVYDVKGRLVAVNPVRELGPGLHTMTLGETEPLPAGVYMVRLTQAGKSVTKRATVIP